MFDFSNIFELGNLYFMIEILLAELIFLYACPKRKWFVLRYLGAVGLCLLLAYFFPMPESRTVRYNVYFLLFRFTLLFAYTIPAMAACFNIKIVPLVSACVAGYAVQHIAYQIATMFTRLTKLYEGVANRSNFIELTIFPVVYLILFGLFGFWAARNKSYKESDVRLLGVSVVTVFICVGLMRFSRNSAYSAATSLYAITCCMLALFIQFNLYRMLALISENKAIRLVWQEEKKQYEISKSSIELVNIKYHDLKRRLSTVNGLTQEEMDSLRETLQLYDSNFRTGNEVLDVILTENSLRHREEGIEFTFMGNGADLAFMSVMDIYSLFGNALENAAEAVKQLDEPEKKSIGVTLEKRGDMLSVSVTNFFSGQIKYQNGLPVTSKQGEEGYHGFGMKSIKLISEKYHGDMKVSTDGDLFTLNVYLMQ